MKTTPTTSCLSSARKFGKLFVPMLLALCFAGLFAACESKRPVAPMKTFETTNIEEQLRQFKNSPTESNMRSVDVALAKMEGEIKELEARLSTAQGADHAETQGKLDTLNRQYRSYQQEFTEAKVKASVNKAVDKVTPSDSSSSNR